MPVIGRVESIWRYPVKSMAGEAMAEAFMGFSGLFGDRCYAIKNSAARKGLPYLTARVQPQMLCYRPQFRNVAGAAAPPNLAEAAALPPGVTSANADWPDLMLDVITPSGACLAIDDPKLLELLGTGLGDDNHLTLVRSDRALTDCRPVSLIGMPTIHHIGTEAGIDTDKRRFRANLYLDLHSTEAFGEDKLIDQKLRIGSQAMVAILERDPRCKMISLDPNTGELHPEVLRTVAKSHGGFAGVYGAVLVEGVIKAGDTVELLD